MTALDFTAFETEHRALGYDEVLERVWPPDTTLDRHTHPFAVKALVTAGEFWLSVGDDTRHLRAGDRFELEPEVPHAERYGSEGATFGVARRRG